MTSLEKLSNDFYETLVQLRYPGLAAQTASTDILETVLARENRLFLLSWLLAQTSLIKDKEFLTKPDEFKILKCYSDMGICNNPDILMARLPIQDQIVALSNLLLFMRNVLCADRSQENSNPQSQVIDIYKKWISENNDDDGWPSCGLTKKLTYAEAIHYAKRSGESSCRKIVCADESLDAMKNDRPADEVCDSMGNKNLGCIKETDRRECIEKFVEAFAVASSWPTAKISESDSFFARSMDNCIDNISSNMATLKETFRSKNEISNFVTMERLERREMPLDGPIEDIVISLEEVNRLRIIE